VVGDPTIQLIDVLAGRLIDELADAEHLADRGDVVLAASAIAAGGAERDAMYDELVDMMYKHSR
jgi:hypothetical protein